MLEKKGWLVRNEDNMLCYCTDKPKKDEEYGYWETEGDLLSIDPDYFSNVKWEDEEPTEVKLTISII